MGIEHSIKELELCELEKILKSERAASEVAFRSMMNKLKLIFLMSSDIEILTKIALVFNTFLIHSSVPLIVSKLLDKKYHKRGGTLAYALLGLKKGDFMEELKGLKDKNISYEMRHMLELNNI
ncbi:MAG: hypothetical protein ABIV51_00615 [Saprospiraceae bacterium]